MQISYASQASPDVSHNEDLVVAGPRFAVVLDGATAVADVDNGCLHDVRWLVERLGAELARSLLTESGPLAQSLADAIERVMAMHQMSCDLRNPDSPSSTVTILRERDDTVDYLVLADSPLVLRDRDGAVTPVLDDRLERLPSRTLEAVREQRNSPGGFWVASTEPAAAYAAVTGGVRTEALDCAGLFSDGVSRLVERHGMGWPDLLRLTETGPADAIERVRQADRQAAGRFRGKTHDDATAVFCRLR